MTPQEEYESFLKEKESHVSSKSLFPYEEKVDQNDIGPMGDKQLLTEVIQALVLKPERVNITEHEHGGITYYTIYADENDVGAILGKSGRTIEALRIIFAAIGFAQGKQNELSIPSRRAKPERHSHGYNQLDAINSHKLTVRSRK